MIVISAERCNGCGEEAISLITPKEAVAEPVRAPVFRPETQIIQVKTESAPAPLRSRLLPIVGGALAWGWREIVPLLADPLLYDLDRQVGRTWSLADRGGAHDNGGSACGGGRGRRRRNRWRGS